MDQQRLTDALKHYSKEKFPNRSTPFLILSYESLRGLDFRGHDLSGQFHLINANLSGADLRGVGFEGVLIQGATFNQVLLTDDKPWSHTEAVKFLTSMMGARL